MPTYTYFCTCGTTVDVVRTMAKRDDVYNCGACGQPAQRKTLYALRAKFPGRVLQGGGPDRLTADVLGIPLKELPQGLRTSRADMKRVEEQGKVDIRPIRD